MNASNLLFGLLWAMIRFQFSEANGRIKLAPRNPRYTKTLVLDVDETLVYTRELEQCKGPGTFQFLDPEGAPSYGHIREGVVETLQALEQGTPDGDRWELIIWTAGTTDYGMEIRKHLLETENVHISWVIGSDASEEVDKKDIRRLIDPKRMTRSLETMVIVDNKPEHCYPGENTIGIRSWWGYNEEIPEWLKVELDKAQRIPPELYSGYHERSFTWSVVGHDGGKAMRQLKFALDELKGKSVTLETMEMLNDKIQENEREESDQMIYYRAQPIMMSKQIETVREAGRGNQYSRTLILDLRNLVDLNILSEVDKQKVVTEKYDETNDWWEVSYEKHRYAVRSKNDAIDTLKTLQQAAMGLERWEFIIWSNWDHELAAKISEILSGKGVDIAHVLGASEWDEPNYNFERNWRENFDITRLVGKTRPLDSMLILDHDRNQCWPRENIVSLGALKREKMVREAGRDKHYSKTLILNLAQDFVYIEKDTNCEGKKDCEFVEQGERRYSVQFRVDAIDTLKMLQQVAPGRDRWELIIWTDKDQQCAEDIAHILSGRGVQIAHVLGGDNNYKDIRRLASQRRPLDSMLIVHNDPTQCLPQENAVGIRMWYGHEGIPESVWKELGRKMAKQLDMIDKDELNASDIDLSLRWPTFGSDDDAMNQLRFVLHELNGERIGVETLSKVIFTAPATTKEVGAQEQMVFFQSAEGSQRIIETKARIPEPRREWRHLIPQRAAEDT